MDNICHTLAGAIIGESGARKTTPLATATLLIGANLPDVDVLAYLQGPVEALAFRRGWTHGALAVVVWPFLLAGAMLLYDRMIRLRRPGTGRSPARFGPLLLLAALAVASHPLLDLLNTYGVRLLMPFSGRWFYGDTLFIIDLYVWIALGLGIWLTRRAERRGSAHPFRPARIALAAVLLYIAVMRSASAAAAGTVSRAMAARNLTGYDVVLSPLPADPRRWNVIVRVADGYALSRWDWTARPRVAREWRQLSTRAAADFARAAAASPEGRRYLVWARLPVFVPGGEDGCPAGMACIRDVRYYGQDWAAVAVPLPPAVSWSRPPTAPTQEQP